MTFPAFWVHYYTILVDNLWHKLCNFLSKYLVSIYFSQSTLLTSFPAVMGRFLKGFRRDRRRDRVLGEADNKNIFFNLSFICGRDSCNDYKLPQQSVSVDLWNVSKRQTLQISGETSFYDSVNLNVLSFSLWGTVEIFLIIVSNSTMLVTVDKTVVL